MNALRMKLQAEMLHRIGHFLFRTGRKWTKESVQQKSYYWKSRTISQSSDGTFRSIYFSRSTGSDLSIQKIIYDDVPANKIRRELNRSIRYAINFPTVIKQAQRLPAVSSEIGYCICLVLGSKAFKVLVFCAIDFSTMDYGMILRLQLLSLHFCHL